MGWPHVNVRFTGGLYHSVSSTILDVALASQIEIVIYFKIAVVFGYGLSASAGNLLKGFSVYWEN